MDVPAKTSAQLEDEATNSSVNEVLVVLQTENGEEIALPISALPSEFVTGAGTQVIMVEDASGQEEGQEVIVQSEDVHTEEVRTEQTIQTETLDVENKVHDAPPIPTAEPEAVPELPPVVVVKPAEVSEDISGMPMQPETETQTVTLMSLEAAQPPILSTPMLTPPTATIEITTTTPIPDSDKDMQVEVVNASGPDQIAEAPLTPVTLLTPTPTPASTPMPTANRRRKAEISMRPMNEEDVIMEFQEIIPVYDEPKSRRNTPRLQRKKKRPYVRKAKPPVSLDSPCKKIALEQSNNISEPAEAKAAVEPAASETSDAEKLDKPCTPTKPTVLVKSETSISSPVKPLATSVETPVKSEPETPTTSIKTTINTTNSTTITTSNTPTIAVDQLPESPNKSNERKAFSQNFADKSYKCSECGFSTDRINNLVAHMKDTCTYAKRRWQSEVEKFKSSYSKARN